MPGCRGDCTQEVRAKSDHLAGAAGEGLGRLVDILNRAMYLRRAGAFRRRAGKFCGLVAADLRISCVGLADQGTDPALSVGDLRVKVLRDREAYVRIRQLDLRVADRTVGVDITGEAAKAIPDGVRIAAGFASDSNHGGSADVGIGSGDGTLTQDRCQRHCIVAR